MSDVATLPLHSITTADAPAVGNKAAKLGTLLQHGLAVPPGFVISLADCRAIWHRGRLSARDNEHLMAAVTEQIGADACLVVRSSGINEDGKVHSHTGALPTEYFVTKETLAVSVLSCLSKAANTANGETQLHSGARSVADPGCALIVQLLVPAIASGVLFTSTPTADHTPSMLIESVWGLGRSLVDGKTDPDRFQVDDNQNIIKRSLGRKQHEISPHTGTGLRTEILSEVSEPRRLAWTLTDAQLHSLTRLASKCEAIFGGPQDIEWALSNTGLCLLQSRPVSQAQQTTESPPAGEWLIFMPLLENFAEPLTPLSADLISEILPQEARMIGGRIYLDAALLKTLVPLDLNQAQLSDLFLFKASPSPFRWQLGKLLRKLPYWLQRTPWLVSFWLRSAQLSKTQLRSFRPYLARLNAQHPEPRTLLRRLARGRGWFTPVVRTPFTLNLSSARYMVLLGLVRALVKRWGVSPLRPDSLAHLCSSSADTMSSEMVSEIEALGRCVAANPKLAVHFRERVDLAGLHATANTTDAWEFLDRYSAFIHRFGHRGSKELDLASRRWVEDPLPLLSLIGVHARKQTAGHDPYANQLVARDDLHQTLKKRWQRYIIDGLLSRIRYYVDLREETRHNCALALFRIRRNLNQLAEQLTDRALLRSPHDLYFLTWREIAELQAGKLTRQEVATRIAQSKKHHQTRCREPVQWQLGLSAHEIAPQHKDQHSIIAGRCAAPGDAEGLVRVINHYSDLNLFQPGEVLVTPYADPVLAAAAQAAAALVCEYGSYLSHMGTLTREFGVPCVVDAQGATASLRSGDRVRVRGSEGRVEMLAAVSMHPRAQS